MRDSACNDPSNETSAGFRDAILFLGLRFDASFKTDAPSPAPQPSSPVWSPQ